MFYQQCISRKALNMNLHLLWNERAVTLHGNDVLKSMKKETEEEKLRSPLTLLFILYL